jgi:hypothetical protein
MDMKTASKLRQEWGDKPCDHHHIVMEDRIFGQWSGDFVCAQCGYSASREDFAKKPNGDPKFT